MISTQALEIIGGVAAFVLLWIVICHVVAHLSGWQRLAEQFEASDPFVGQPVRLWHVNMRFLTHYDNVILMGSDSIGLSFSMSMLFRLGHPALFIPWGEISVAPPERSLFGPVTTLRLGRDAQITIRIYGRKAERFLAQTPISKGPVT